MAAYPAQRGGAQKRKARKKRSRTEVSSSSESDSDVDQTSSTSSEVGAADEPHSQDLIIKDEIPAPEPTKSKKTAPASSPSSSSSSSSSSSASSSPDRDVRMKDAASLSPSPSPAPEAASMTKPKVDPAKDQKAFGDIYLRKVAAELADDLDKVREAQDFKASSIPMLVHALRQGESLFSAEEKRRVVGTTEA